MSDLNTALDQAGLTNDHVHSYVQTWAAVTGAERIEVVSAGDDARLIQESLDAGELLPAGEGRYYSRSYFKDTARAEERTIVATSDMDDKGVYNNWRHSAEMKPLLRELMAGASAGKTMLLGHTDPKVTVEHYIRRNEQVNPLTAELLDQAFAHKDD